MLVWCRASVTRMHFAQELEPTAFLDSAIITTAHTASPPELPTEAIKRVAGSGLPTKIAVYRGPRMRAEGSDELYNFRRTRHDRFSSGKRPSTSRSRMRAPEFLSTGHDIIRVAGAAEEDR